ncbi:MAG: hypothetical protein IRZ33_08395 [Alicyclobacillaceae bacterium]|nr:hypothetical protein [Alicyclobacillaceae bacterium]
MRKARGTRRASKRAAYWAVTALAASGLAGAPATAWAAQADARMHGTGGAHVTARIRLSEDIKGDGFASTAKGRAEKGHVPAAAGAKVEVDGQLTPGGRGAHAGGPAGARGASGRPGARANAALLAAIQAAIARTDARVQAEQAAYDKVVQAAKAAAGRSEDSSSGTAPAAGSAATTSVQADMQATLQKLASAQSPEQALALLARLQRDIAELQAQVERAAKTASLPKLLSQSQQAVGQAQSAYAQARANLEALVAAWSKSAGAADGSTGAATTSAGTSTAASTAASATTSTDGSGNANSGTTSGGTPSAPADTGGSAAAGGQEAGVGSAGFAGQRIDNALGKFESSAAHLVNVMRQWEKRLNQALASVQVSDSADESAAAGTSGSTPADAGSSVGDTGSTSG